MNKFNIRKTTNMITEVALIAIAATMLTSTTIMQSAAAHLQTVGGYMQVDYRDRHPTLCALGPSALGATGHPFLGYGLHWWCNNAS
jgi:hypothetical protein